MPRTIAAPAVQSNEYTICTGFEMHQVVGDSNPVPRRINMNKAHRGQYDRSIQDIQKKYNEWHDIEFGLV